MHTSYMPIARRDLCGNDRGRPRTSVELVTELIAPLVLCAQYTALGPLLWSLGLDSITEGLLWRLVYTACLCMFLIAVGRSFLRKYSSTREPAPLQRWRDSYITRRIRERQGAAR